MSSLSSAAVAQVIATYQGVMTTVIVNISTTGKYRLRVPSPSSSLIAYDVLLTFGQEYLYIWRSRKSWFTRILYMWNRYMYLLYSLLILGTIPSMSNTEPKHQMLVRRLLANRQLLTYPDSTVTIASRGSLILVDSLAAAVTWRQTRAATQLRTGTGMKRPFLQQVMWENGTVYFCVLVSLNVVNLLLVLLSLASQPLDDQSSYVLVFIDPISSSLNSRFLLALHETNTRLGGTNTSISSLSFNIASGGDPGAGSPEPPEFLGIIGGSIHSFHDDDGDLDELAFAPPQEEHQLEPEGEVLEVGRESGDLTPGA
ncbi:uncharacterized protein TRAVEDRAFT_43403 [Trametes versicolor FP-101664 SS1]|uniref:uncharacterized protein n=1 Tax=Trametes versicolor (strain FP-101664) TaxID=717944 RepID=UPI000462123A|nr:uncharacterized protein TRAVEDRAFT_43403 [Trametes versicolor FP-101664 SS1]EIW63096.1 hypothetical protein TRAVEDRAFT_43403 [Trametes versicolor FP-101664 SS1]